MKNQRVGAIQQAPSEQPQQRNPARRCPFAMVQQTTAVAHSGAEDFAHGAPNETSVLSKPDHSHDLNPSQRGSTLVDSGSGGGVHRSDSTMSQSHTLTPSRGGTLKKKRSLSKKGSVKRSGSRRSSYAGSVKGLGFADQQYDGATDDEMNSAFFTPVPTTGTPTEILADRFQSSSPCHLLFTLRANGCQLGGRFSKTSLPIFEMCISLTNLAPSPSLHSPT